MDASKVGEGGVPLENRSHHAGGSFLHVRNYGVENAPELHYKNTQFYNFNFQCYAFQLIFLRGRVLCCTS